MVQAGKPVYKQGVNALNVNSSNGFTLLLWIDKGPMGSEIYPKFFVSRPPNKIWTDSNWTAENTYQNKHIYHLLLWFCKY